MTITADNCDHEHYSGLTLLPDVLRRYDYAKDKMSAAQFVRLLSSGEVIALADTTSDAGAIDARRAADFMWMNGHRRSDTHLRTVCTQPLCGVSTPSELTHSSSENGAGLRARPLCIEPRT